MADQDMLHTAELVKAALPFVDTRTKVVAELFVKVFELMGSVKSFRGSSNLAACGFEAGKIDVEGLLNGIRPVCNQREIEVVDRILNIFRMKRMFEMYNNLMEAMKTMQEFGGFPFGEAGEGADTDTVTGNFGGANFESIFQSLKGFKGFDTTADTGVSDDEGDGNRKEETVSSGEWADDSRERMVGNAERTDDNREGAELTREQEEAGSNVMAGKGSGDMMFEMLKTMIPEDKISTFENLSMLLNTMSYDNKSKPEQKERSNG